MSEPLNTPLENSRIRRVIDRQDILDCRRWLKANGPKLITVDVETTGLSRDDELTSIQFGNQLEAWVIDPMFPNVDQLIASLLLHEHLLAHNAPFDAYHLAEFSRANPLLPSMSQQEILAKMQDTQILSKLVDPRNKGQGGVGHSLKDLAAHWIGKEAKEAQEQLQAGGKEWDEMSIYDDDFVRYGGMDVILTARLFQSLEFNVKALGVEHLVEFDRQVQQIVTGMSERGMRVDPLYATDLYDELGREEDGYRGMANALGVSNVSSNREVSSALLLRGHELSERTPSGDYKVDKVVLGQIDDDICRAVLGAKQANKAMKSWVGPLIDAGTSSDGRVHATINPSNAVTYRMSISNPGLHQLPSNDHRIRSCLIADAGQTLISCDFSQVELRVVAALAREQAMIDVFRSGGDIHSATAARLYGANFTPQQRGLAKNTAFGVVYGGGAATLARQAGIALGEAKQTIDNFYFQFPGVRRWSNSVIDYVKERRPCVVTYTGRQIPLDPNFAYKGVNYQVQSLAGDIFKQSLINLNEHGLAEHLLLPIHDEVIAQAPKAQAAEVAREIEFVMSNDLDGVPLTAEAEVIGFRWGDKYAPKEVINA
jgi:DNA polymerase-1